MLTTRQITPPTMAPQKRDRLLFMVLRVPFLVQLTDVSFCLFISELSVGGVKQTASPRGVSLDAQRRCR
jgi:hypothetical protein